MMSDSLPTAPTRRSLLGKTALGGAALATSAALAGCFPEASPKPSASSAPSAGAEGATAHVVAAAADLPRGSKLSVTVAERSYLLFRPSETEVLAYRALCTHAGCKVEPGEAHNFHCPCHESEFLPEDGSAVAGPARQPLERFAAELDGEDVVLYV